MRSLARIFARASWRRCESNPENVRHAIDRGVTTGGGKVTHDPGTSAASDELARTSMEAQTAAARAFRRLQLALS